MPNGYFELLQGNVRPGSILIASIGPPCVPEATWHACEPAMTIVPNFLITGIPHARLILYTGMGHPAMGKQFERDALTFLMESTIQ